MTYGQLEELLNKIDKYEEVLYEIREKLKEIKYDLDFEPWSIYKISGDKLFYLVQILENVKEKGE